MTGNVYNWWVPGPNASREAVRIFNDVTPSGVESPRVACEHPNTPVRC